MTLAHGGMLNTNTTTNKQTDTFIVNGRKRVNNLNLKFHSLTNLLYMSEFLGVVMAIN